VKAKAMPTNALTCELFKCKLTDVEVNLSVLVFVLINEVHHLLISTLSLFHTGFAAPFLDGIFYGRIDIITGFVEWCSITADGTLFREEVAFIMHIIDLTATFTDSV
jgi:hypothetical protein